MYKNMISGISKKNTKTKFWIAGCIKETQFDFAKSQSPASLHV
jgi:hypothetical protein